MPLCSFLFCAIGGLRDLCFITGHLNPQIKVIFCGLHISNNNFFLVSVRFICAVFTSYRNETFYSLLRQGDCPEPYFKTCKEGFVKTSNKSFLQAIISELI